LVDPPLRPLTLREAKVSGLSVINQFEPGGRLADRSWGFVGVSCRGLWFNLVRRLGFAANVFTSWSHN
jgi:hypothetical protein